MSTQPQVSTRRGQEGELGESGRPVLNSIRPPLGMTALIHRALSQTLSPLTLKVTEALEGGGIQGN